MSYLHGDHGLTPRILLDITAAAEAGRFQVENPRLALAATVGSVLATLQMALADPDFAAQPVDEQLAEHLLRMFGLPADEARRLSAGPLPLRAKTYVTVEPSGRAAGTAWHCCSAGHGSSTGGQAWTHRLSVSRWLA